MDQPTASPNQGNRARRRGFLALGVLVILGALAWGTRWLLVDLHFESTDDAYVSADIVQVTSQVPGTVTAVYVDDTQGVRRGELLASLDPADARIALNSAEADLARAVRNVRGLFAQRDALRAQIAQRATDLQRAQSDLGRRQGLLADGAVSGEELAHARDAVSVAQAALDAAREQLNATEAQIQGTTIETHPQVLAAEAAVRDAALALRRTQLRAPCDGVIAKRSVQVGQRIAAGAPLMLVVPLRDVWVDANFKEVQLRDMRVGQPVELHADLYGDAVSFHGRLAGLAAGSGSAFALLPAQNASGNWIKIVQRLPVRIALDPRDLRAHPLRVGLSMSARVDVHDTSGALVSDQVSTTPLPALASDGVDPQLETQIRAIVEQNAGHASARTLHLARTDITLSR
ncbi:MAG TPA: efflux RND transporter periplasmic adaptor subunit [Steroidobacteraceae bacterium]|nr:efflux RND transporter periplasmic adaptor subunit [Steroidobacteraceae bacterium]